MVKNNKKKHRSSNIKDSNIFFVPIFVLIVSIIYYQTGYSLFWFIGLFVSIMYLLLCNCDGALFLIAVFLPNTVLTSFMGISYLDIIFIFLFFKFIVQEKYVSVIEIFFVGILLLSLVITDILNSKLQMVLYGCRYAVIYFVMMNLLKNFNLGLLKTFTKAFCLGNICNSICSIVYDQRFQQGYLRLNGLEGANMISMLNMLAIGFILVNIFYCHKVRIFDVFYIIFLLYIALLTVSRGGILVGLFNLIILLCILLKTNKQYKYIIGFLCILFFMFYLYKNYEVSKIMLLFEKRFEHDNVKTLGSRIIIWRRYIHEWGKNIWTMLFGVGIMANEFQATHCLYISLLSNIGIVGSLIYVCIYINVFVKLPKLYKLKLPCICLLGEYFVGGISHTYLFDVVFTVLGFFIFYMLSIVDIRVCEKIKLT